MRFVLKLMVLIVTGWLFGWLVGLAFDSPTLSVAAFLIWAVLNRKAFFAAPRD